MSNIIYTVVAVSVLAIIILLISGVFVGILYLLTKFFSWIDKKLDW